MRQYWVIGLLAAVVIGFAAWEWQRTFVRPGTNSPEFPDGFYYVCSQTNCLHTFHLTVRERGAYSVRHWGEVIRCPRCQAEAVWCAICVHCGLAGSPHGTNQWICTHCNGTNAPNIRTAAPDV